MIANRLTRVEHRETSDGAGWFIVGYESPQAMMRGSPNEIVGPYDTQAHAVRILNSAALPPPPGVRVDLASPPGAAIPPIDAA